LLTLIRNTLGILVALLPVLWAIEWLAGVRSMFLLDQFVVVEFGLATALVFLSPRGRPVRSYDYILAALALVVAVFSAVSMEKLVLLMFSGDAQVILLAGTLVGLSLLACYRVTGAMMTAFVSAVLVFGALARYLPQPISAPPFSLGTYTVYIAYGGDAIVGQALRIVSVVVVVFIVFGKMFELMGGTRFFEHLAQRISANGAGSAVKVAAVASGLFGSISGSTTANVVTSGNFSIPMMRKIGLPAHQAAAIEAVASTGGQILPPVMGIAAFLMVEIAGIPYRDIIIAAALPGLLYFVALFFQIDGFSRRLNLIGFKVEPMPLRQTLIEALFTLVPILLIIFAVITMPYAPNTGAVLASGACIVLAFGRTGFRKTLRELFYKLVEAGDVAARIVATSAVIGILLGVVSYSGLGVAAAVGIEALAESNLALALLAAGVASYVLGIGLATTAVYAVVGTLIAPSLVNLGLAPIAAHLFVFYCAMLSMITPPVAIACLAASGLANASFWRTSLQAMRFGWTLFFLPFLFVVNPALLMIGTLPEILITSVTCLIGIAALSRTIGEFPCPSSNLPRAGLYIALSIIALMPVAPPTVRLLAATGLILLSVRDRKEAKRTLSLTVTEV
jgi:TRAP transporter 4TM/12TM fusion protein